MGVGRTSTRTVTTSMKHPFSKSHVSFILSGAFLLLAAVSHSSAPWYSYELTLNEEGVATVNADLTLPTPLETSYAVLSDYVHWPSLFARNPTVNTIHRTGNRVTVDMTVPGLIFPLDLQLVTETREHPPLRLETSFVKGDFDQYAWVWNLMATDDHLHTQATLELYVKPSLWAPQWLFRTMLEQELETHFQKLHYEVVARQRRTHPPPIMSAARDSR